MFGRALDLGRNSSRVLLVAVFVTLDITASATVGASVVIPAVDQIEKRNITVDDVMAVRAIDSLSVSPDGRRFAMFVRQADPLINAYRTAWYVGTTQGSEPIRVGDGGAVGPRVMWTGHTPGVVSGGESRWSPDGLWIAYTLQRDGEVQLWRSRADGSLQEKLTDNPADVRDFVWSEDGHALYFSVGTPRAELRAREQARDWDGYRFDEDLWQFTDFLGPQLIRPLETNLSVWRVTPGDRKGTPGEEKPASDSDRAAFERLQARQAGRLDQPGEFFQEAVTPPVARAGGGWVWLVKSHPPSQHLRVVASVSKTGSEPVTCPAEECSGAIRKVWWSEDGRRVLFWRNEGINDAANGFYYWNPRNGRVAVIARADYDEIRLCSQARDDRLICVRENSERPDHVVAIDLKSGRTSLAADVNPEFRNIHLGKVERFEWDTPALAWNEPAGALEGLYPKRAYGYLIYPPDFDRSKRYPVFIDPYMARGFRPLGAEHALQAYAANGFVVLRTEFPLPRDRNARGVAAGMKQLYSADLGFPHLTMLMESTLRGLDIALARGFIDAKRVGIGGVSHGTFVPLYLVQKKYDRIAAISISSPSWGPFQHYWGTNKSRDTIAMIGGTSDADWSPKPEGEGAEYWRQIDIADHVDKIEAPILMHLAAHETYALLRLIRHLADANKPYDTYVFTGETHLKWQPAHLQAIMRRNLDWFRFWLQDYEDASPAKADQYLKWRALKR